MTTYPKSIPNCQNIAKPSRSRAVTPLPLWFSALLTYYLLTYLPTWSISARDVSHWKPAFGREKPFRMFLAPGFWVASNHRGLSIAVPFGWASIHPSFWWASFFVANLRFVEAKEYSHCKDQDGAWRFILLRTLTRFPFSTVTRTYDWLNYHSLE